MPTRLERWMRSNDSAMTARTPCSLGPLAAQSRLEPEPYSLPARMMRGDALLLVLHGRVEDGHLDAIREVTASR